MVRFGITGRASGTRGACGLAVVYAIALLLAPTAHDHHESHQEVPQAQVGCDDPGSHWAGHTHTPDLSQPADYCPACQHRAESLPGLDLASFRQTLPTAPHVVADVLSAPQSHRPAISCRGPPRV